MGRQKSEATKHLPKNMVMKGNSYYAVTSKAGKRIWVPLGQNLEYAIRLLKNLTATDSRFSDFEFNLDSNGFVLYEGYPVHIDCAELQGLLTKIYKSIKSRTNSNGKEFNISYEEFLSLYKRSKGKCELTGIPFSFVKEESSWTSNPWVPSLDRIDNKAGYSLQNCRFLCNAVNRSLGEWGDLVFSKIATSYVKSASL